MRQREWFGHVHLGCLEYLLMLELVVTVARPPVLMYTNVYCCYVMGYLVDRLWEGMLVGRVS